MHVSMHDENKLDVFLYHLTTEQLQNTARLPRKNWQHDEFDFHD